MSTIKANTLLHSDGSTTTQPSIPALDKRMAKAWVNFVENTVVINDSYNVSSVTDNSTGVFTVNFAVNMSSANYVALGTPYHHGGVAASGMLSIANIPTTSSVQFYRANGVDGANYETPGTDSILVFGN